MKQSVRIYHGCIWPFWNSFLERKWFGHLVFSWPFFNLEENSIFLGLFWLNFKETVYDISKFIWYIFFENLAFIWPLFGLYLAFIWPFSPFENLAFFIFWDLATLGFIALREKQFWIILLFWIMDVKGEKEGVKQKVTKIIILKM